MSLDAPEPLLRHTRRSDAIARLGGDEFVILMPNTGKTDCSTLCRDLSGTIAGRMAEAGFTITASIGCATFKEPPESLAAALRNADKAMFAAKVMRSRLDLTRGKLLFTTKLDQRALAVLCAAPVFTGSPLARAVRALFVVAGLLALAGFGGVVSGDMRIRNIGIVGYVGVFPVAVLLLAGLFYRTRPGSVGLGD